MLLTTIFFRAGPTLAAFAVHVALALPTAALAQTGVPTICAADKTNVLWVGKNREYRTVSAAVDAMKKGKPAEPGVVCVEAGVYENDFPGAITFAAHFIGVGGNAEMRATVAHIPNQKAIFITRSDIAFENFTFRGAKVNDKNGAGIRFEGGTLTVKNCIFVDNENGILGGSRKEDGSSAQPFLIRVEGSQFLRNGHLNARGEGDGQTHGIYAAGDELIVSESYFAAQREGHNVKSRAKRTVVTRNVLEDGLDGPKQIASYSVDTSNGGTVEVTDNVIVQRNAQGNPSAVQGAILAYAAERRHIHDGHRLTVTGNTVVNYLSRGARLISSGDPELLAIVRNNRFSDVDAVLIGQGRAEQRNNATVDIARAPLWQPKPGTLVGLQRGTDTSPWRFVELDRATGKPLSALAIVGGPTRHVGFALAERSVLANRHFGLGELDFALGTSTLYEGSVGLAAVTAIGKQFWAVTQDGNMLAIHHADRALDRVIKLEANAPLAPAGLAGDGKTVFVASRADGGVHAFDANGKRVGRFESKAAAGDLAGLAYDPADGSLWLAVGGARPELRQFDRSGKQLNTVAIPGLELAGLQVVPADFKPRRATRE